MRVGLPVDRSLRLIDPDGTLHRTRVLDMIAALAEEVHRTGPINEHADTTERFGYAVNDISTCRYPLCVEALALMRDIREIAKQFPIQPAD